MGSLFGAILLGSGLPFTSTQLLWLNLVTETIIGVGMAYEHAHGNELCEKPNDLNKGILSKESVPMLATNAILMVILVLATYAYYLPSGFAVASTSAFLVLYFTQFFNLLNFRSFHQSVFKIGIFSNKIINIGILISILLQVGVLTIPAVRSVLGFYPVSITEFILLFVLSSSVLWAGELQKMLVSKTKNQK
jgi:Ca2+-transporting ATPase